MSYIPNNNPGSKRTRKFGYNGAVNTTKEDIWEGGGTYVFPSDTGDVCEVVSDSTEDDIEVTSTGAKTLFIGGLDENFVEKEVQVDLTGTAAVEIGTFTRINRAYVLLSGSSGSNVGTISIRNKATSSTIYATITPTNGQTLMAIYTVPADTKGYLYTLTASMLRESASTKAADVTLYYRYFGSNTRRIQSHIAVHGNNPTNTIGYRHAPDLIPEKTDIICCGTATSASIVTAEFQLLMRQARY